MIEALEAGDLGAFPNPAYAKSFLLLYGKYLSLDVKAVAAEIDTAMQVTVDDYQYLSHTKETTRDPARRSDFARPHSLPSWTPVLALGGSTAVVVFAFMVWLNMSRIGGGPSVPPPKPGTDKEAIEPATAGTLPEKVNVELPARHRSVSPAVPMQPEPPAVVQSNPQPEPAPHVPTAVVASGQAPLPVYPKIAPPPLPASRPAVTKEPPSIGVGPVTRIDGIEVRTAKVISPVARLASNDAALLSQVESAPQTPPPLVGLEPIEESDGDDSPLANDPNTVEIESSKKTWIVIRSAPGGSPIFEDFLYPSVRPMRLPAGKYVIEVRDDDAVEIRKAGHPIAYTTGGLKLE